jgi:hypothetical protein
VGSRSAKLPKTGSVHISQLSISSIWSTWSIWSIWSIYSIYSILSILSILFYSILSYSILSYPILSINHLPVAPSRSITEDHGLRFAARDGCLKCVMDYVEQGVAPWLRTGWCSMGICVGRLTWWLTILATCLFFGVFQNDSNKITGYFGRGYRRFLWMTCFYGSLMMAPLWPWGSIWSWRRPRKVLHWSKTLLG